jgi:hypothetical protein
VSITRTEKISSTTEARCDLEIDAIESQIDSKLTSDVCDTQDPTAGSVNNVDAV